jgi:hypothetical protein
MLSEKTGFQVYGRIARLLLAPVAFLALIVGTADANIIVLTGSPADPDRSITAFAQINTDFDNDSIFFSQGGAFSNSVLALASGDGIALATADQTSDIPDLVGTSMSGTGSAFGAVLPDAGSTGTFSATSFFEVFFELDTPDVFRFNGELFYDASNSVTGYSQAVLVDVTNSTALFFLQKDLSDSGFASFDELFNLQTGTVYRLTLWSVTAAPLDTTDTLIGNASWQFRFRSNSIVPEPSSALLFVTAAIPGVVAITRKRFNKAA